MKKSIFTGVIRRLLLSMAIISSGIISLNAQNANITLLSSPTSAVTDAEGNVFMLAGSGQLEYALNFPIPVKSISEAYWNINGTRTDINYSINGNAVTINTKGIFTPPAEGKYAAPQATITYIPISEESTEEAEPVTINVSAAPVEVFATPSTSLSRTPLGSVFEGTHLTFTAVATGGNPDGWEYDFRNTESATGNQGITTATLALNNNPAEVRSINYAPDGQTVWFNRTETFPVTVYSTPGMTLTTPGRTEYIPGETIFLNSSVTGGDPSSWTYKWTANGEVLPGNSSTLSYTTRNDSSSPQQVTIELTATNSPVDIDSPLEIKKSFTFTVYPVPSFSGLSDHPTAVFDGQSVKFSFSVNGGNPDGWVYILKENGRAVDSKAITPGTSVTMEVKAGPGETITYGIEVQNSYGDQVYTASQESTITGYATPAVTLSAPERTEYIPGETISLNTTPTGGDPAAWTYAWTVNGQPAGSNSPTFNYNTSETPGEVTIEVTATNAPNGIESPMTIKRSFSFTVYPTPSFSGLSDHPTAVFSDQPLNIDFSVNGGNPDGWVYILKENGVTSRTESITPGTPVEINLGIGNVSTPSNSTYTIEVQNSYGDQTYTASQETTISYFPTPELSLSAPGRIEYIPGETISLNTIPTGGDSAAWTYEWALNGQPIGSNAPSLSYSTVNTGDTPAEMTIEVTATNAPAGIGAPMAIKRSFTFTVYPAPSFSGLSEHPTAAFSGVDLKVNFSVNGGNPDGWKYIIRKDGVEIGTNSIAPGTQAEENLALSNVTAPLSSTYIIEVQNSYGDQTYTAYQETIINYYPTPEATLTTPEVLTYFPGDKFDLRVNPTGGDSSAWSYEWTVDGQNPGTTGSDITVTAANPTTSAKTVKITCTAVNAPAGIGAPVSIPMEFTVTVYPMPEVTPISLPYSAVFNGTTVKITSAYTGGNPEGWTFQWYDNGTLLDTTASELDYTAINNGATEAKHTIRVVASNMAESSKKVFESELPLSVWPTMTAALVTPDVNEWFTSRTFPLSWTIQGGAPTSRTYSWELVSGQSTNLGSSATLDYTTTLTGTAAQQYTIRATVTDAPAGIDKPAVTVTDFTFTVYPLPTITSLTPAYPVIFSGTSVDLTAVTAGGKAGSWSYKWEENSTSLTEADGLKITRTPINNGTASGEMDYHFTASNTVGGETVTVEAHTGVTVWPVADATLVSPSRTEWVSGETLVLSATTTGGNPDAWSFSWNYRGQTFTDRDFSYILLNNGTAGTSETVTLTATNAPQGINAPYTVTRTFAFMLYPEPGIVNPIQSSGSIFSSESVMMSIGAVGGNPGGWTYSWTHNGTALDFTTPSITQTLTSNGSAADHTYVVTATNDFDGETRSFSHTFTVTVWPTPTATLNSPVRDGWLTGESVPFNVTVNGGNPTAWKYTWSVDDTATANDDTYNYVAPDAPVGGAQHTITLLATNAPEGIGTPFTYTATYTCAVYPVPYLSPEAETVNQVVFNGTDVHFSAEGIGGYPDGWAFSWEKNGSAFSGTEATLSVQAENTGSASIIDTYTLKAVNTLFDTTTELEQSFTLTTWPTPSVRLIDGLPENVLSGDPVTVTALPSGGDPYAWQYAWSVDGTENANGTEEVFTTTLINTNRDENAKHTITVTATNAPDGIDNAFHTTLTYEFDVWPAPSSESIAASDIVILSGSELNIGAEYYGGQSEEWTIEWTLNGTPMENASAIYHTTVENTTTVLHTDVYTLTLTNKVESETRYQHTYTYTVNIYPTPEVTPGATQLEAYYGNDVILEVTPRYGYPDGWSFTWSEDLPDMATVSYTVPNSQATESEHTVTLTVTNSYGSETWFSQEYVFTVKGWSRGTITPVTVLEANYNGTLTIDLTTSQTGGYPGGWTYQWYLNGEFQTDGLPYLTVTETNYGPDAESFNWELIAVNTLDGIVGSRTSIPFSTVIWPVIEAPTGFTASTLNITNGGSTVLSATPAAATGGYLKTWQYTWTADGNTIGGNSPVVTYTANMPDNGMGYTDVILGLYLVNAGPTGTNWFEQRYPSQTLRVYNRPVAPAELVRKGNGTTCTLIAMSTLTDAQLADANYEFVFGYTDANGRDYSMPATADRFCRFQSDIYNNASNDFWVYTQWRYSNGAIVTSQRRHLSGTLDDFNGSDYTATGRGDSAGIDDVDVDDNDIHIDSRGFKVQLAVPAAATVRILNVSGCEVFRHDYPASASFTETFGTRKLSTGVYVVVVEAGSMTRIKKVVIR